MISAEDLSLFEFADTPQAAFKVLQTNLEATTRGKTPDFAHAKDP